MTLHAPPAHTLYNEYAIPAFDEVVSLYSQRLHKSARRLGSLRDIQEVDQRLQNNLDHLRYFEEAAKYLCEERY